MSRQRTILHVDMDAFFASVEQLDNPALRGKPVIVGAPRDKRGVVAAASYEARAFGIHSAMPSREAARLCPQAIFVPPHPERYEAMSRHVFSILERFTPLIEPLSIDEAFMDVTGSARLFGAGPAIAENVREAIRGETHLTASVGVAPNKFLAKLASEMNKPDGLTVVPTDPADIVRFLAPLPVRRLWGAGKITCRQLEQAGLMTFGDLQKSPVAALGSVVGMSAAAEFKLLVCGEDDREVEVEWEAKSISREHTFDEDCRNVDVVEACLLDLVDAVGACLREDGWYAGLARLKVRWQGFDTLTRQRVLPTPVCDDFSLREVAVDLWRALEKPKPVRLIGFGTGHLARSVSRQMGLFEARAQDPARRENLSKTVDDIRRRFGPGSIRRAASGKGLPPEGLD